MVQYDLRKQNEDARLINLAGRQRMISQRISKLTLYIKDDLQNDGATSRARLDTLRSLIRRWENVHASLSVGSDEFGISNRRSPAIDLLLSKINLPLTDIIDACDNLITKTDKKTASETVELIEKNELLVLTLLEQTVNTFQNEAERKLRRTKTVEIILAVTGLTLLFMEFVFLFLPIIRKMQAQNDQQTELNNQLAATNEELQASEEELKTNLDFISALQTDLSLREKQYRYFVEHATDLIYELNGEGKFSYVNPVMETVTGYSKQVLSTKTYWEIVEPAMQEETKSFYERQRRERIRHTYFELRVRTIDSKQIWIGQNVVMHFGEDKRVSKVTAIARDISLEKETQEALQLAKEKAEEATNAKSQFLSMMSHEIRTPMNAIIGLTNILMQEEPRHDQVENLKLLKFSGQNLLTIINDILDFSKIEAGKINLEEIDVDLLQTLTNLIQMLSGAASDKGIQLTLDYDRRIGSVYKTDPVRLSQVVTNLLGNAIKFTDRGRVEMRVRESKENNGLVEFSISDTGIGIDADKLDLIFESFSQANLNTTRKFGGTGLGLSITKKLIELMGGAISVESRPRVGSTFTFILPLKKGDRKKIFDESSPALSNAKHPGAKILLVEDNRVNQIVACNFFKKWGFEVALANNGKEALDKIKDKSFHLVLMDLQMPEMDGYETTRIIRSWKHDTYFLDIPIIALTASAMAEVRQRVQDTGMNEFIIKPFEPEELYTTISKHLKEVRVEPAAYAQSIRDKLDQYSDGDATFKRELAGHLINNIEELKHALHESLKKNDEKIFGEACHKIATTLNMLADTALLTTIAKLKKQVGNSSVSTSDIEEFETRCQNLINQLKNQIDN